MQCPKCRLENPQNTVWCDCGYNFSTSEMDEVHKPTTIRRRNEETDGYFSFQKMISPTLIRWAYVIGIVGIVIAAIYLAYSGFKEADDTAKLLKGLAALLLATAGNLVWRVVCEQAILLFSIHERLASIDRSLRRR